MTETKLRIRKVFITGANAFNYYIEEEHKSYKYINEKILKGYKFFIFPIVEKRNIKTDEFEIFWHSVTKTTFRSSSDNKYAPYCGVEDVAFSTEEEARFFVDNYEYDEIIGEK